MCDPVSLGVFSMGTTLASTGLGVMGQMQQGQLQQAMYGYQAQVARNNQIAAERLAVDAEKQGRIAEDRQRLRTRARMGTQVAELAGQGTDLEGSPTDILGDAAAGGEMDALAIRSNATREAWSDRTKGVEFDNEAMLANSRQRWSRLSPLGVGASLIGGAGAFADKWYRFRL
jgi:hypothetical protein